MSIFDKQVELKFKKTVALDALHELRVELRKKDKNTTLGVTFINKNTLMLDRQPINNEIKIVDNILREFNGMFT